MKKNFESILPDGYLETMVIDAKNTKLSILLNLVAIIIAAAILVSSYLIIRPDFFADNDFFRKDLLFCGALFVYIVLHELTHGIAYKLLTHQKLTFGLTLTVAYCGVPNIYVYRKAALIALLAPFIVFSVIFGISALLLQNSVDKMLAMALFALHIGGCSGDLYDTLLYLFKFKRSDTLMRDTGPKQTFYTKE